MAFLAFGICCFCSFYFIKAGFPDSICRVGHYDLPVLQLVWKHSVEYTVEKEGDIVITSGLNHKPLFYY